MLPFTADVLFASLAQYNRDLWPAQILALVLGAAAVVLAVRPVRGGERAIGAVLAAAWLWTGIGYHFLHFATLNFAAPIYAAFFVLEGLLVAWTVGVRGKPGFCFRPNVVGWSGLVLVLAALFAWPFADWLGHGWQSARLAGLAPGTTAALTLGLLLLGDGRAPVHLAVIPLLWTLVAGATAWILAIPQDVVLAAAGVVAFALILWKNRRDRL